MKRDSSDDYFRDSTMSFGEHLEELRICLWRAVLGLAIGTAIGLLFANQIVQFVQIPLVNALTHYYEERAIEDAEAAGNAEAITGLVRDDHLLPQPLLFRPRDLIEGLKKTFPDADLPELPPESTKPIRREDLVELTLYRRADDDERLHPIATGTQEPFMIWLKAGLVGGALLSSPWVFYQLWLFVAAGLYPHERKYIYIFLPFSLGLFFAGAALAFFFVFDPVLNFLLTFNHSLGIDPEPRINEWMSFVLVLPLGFGISFQLPLVMLFLERVGILDVKTYLSNWRISVLVIVVLSAILTPADPYSLLFMAVPLTALYFGGVALCHYFPRSRSPIPALD